MLKDRIIGAAILIAVLSCVLFSDSVVMYIAVCAVSVMSLIEIYRAMGFLKTKPVGVLLFFILGILLLPALVLVRVLVPDSSMIIAATIYAYIVLAFLIAIICHKDIRLKDILALCAMSGVIVCFLMFIIMVRQMSAHGNLLVWAIFVGACMTDTCAYFTGLCIGRHKLTPVSPKKTVEGAIGGLVGACVSMLVYGVVCQAVADVSVSFLHLAVLGALCGLVAQVGDLSFSLLKREAGIKDFGHLFPGHGGILDRIDSILFVAPLVYFYVSNFTVFV